MDVEDSERKNAITDIAELKPLAISQAIIFMGSHFLAQ